MCSNISYAATKNSKNSKSKSESQHQQKRLKINPVTDEGDAWTVNAESGIYRAGTFENIGVGYSNANGWDFSLSLINTQILGPNKLFQGDIFANIAKTFSINNELSIVVGTQNGFAAVNQHPRLWYNYDYLDNRYDATSWLSLHGGAYLANAELTGTNRQVGYMTGTEVTFIPHLLALQLDYTSGHQAVSGATANMLLNITPQFQTYMGVYVPERNSGNEFAGIIGFNLSSKHF
jgi:hypothetical protein